MAAAGHTVLSSRPAGGSARPRAAHELRPLRTAGGARSGTVDFVTAPLAFVPRARVPVTNTRDGPVRRISFDAGMTERLSSSLSELVQAFFGEHLPQQRALSPRTVASYRDAFRLFSRFLQTRTGKSRAELALADFSPEHIRAFLDHLEHARGNSIHSCNIRLAALRAFLKFAAPWDGSPARAVERSLAVPMKHFVRPRPEVLSPEQVLAIIGAASDSWISHRDHTLLSLLYSTAASVSEIIRLRVDELLLEGAACVHFHGTRRARSVPLRSDTVGTLRLWLARNPQLGPGAILLPNQRGDAMTTTCVRRRLALAVRRAAALDPTLVHRRISPRSIRHSAAMHLLQGGIDIGLITRWLGHDTPATMHNHARGARSPSPRDLTQPAM